ncbi:PREDICTED: uncharacterized protein LOC106810591 isoform X2 [Priapulus caudatus]|uniref:Centrosomal protein of 44 kDa n=1 Tax=Priapulus caudatus TaxID=37621 RepID=A0ABM1EBB1_PRICU|nr:PREDICTED: uncharacterized protein LOC106810591 isoform X2 [Priapulus caudatus]
MATGDLYNNLKKLQHVLKQMNLSSGCPEAIVPLYRYAFTSYSQPLMEDIAKLNIVEMTTCPDIRFIEKMYKVLRELFAYKAPLTKDQFFTKELFVEKKIIMATDILRLVRERSPHILYCKRSIVRKGEHRRAASCGSYRPCRLGSGLSLASTGSEASYATMVSEQSAASTGSQMRAVTTETLWVDNVHATQLPVMIDEDGQQKVMKSKTKRNEKSSQTQTKTHSHQVVTDEVRRLVPSSVNYSNEQLVKVGLTTSPGHGDHLPASNTTKAASPVDTYRHGLEQQLATTMESLALLMERVNLITDKWETWEHQDFQQCEKSVENDNLQLETETTVKTQLASIAATLANLSNRIYLVETRMTMMESKIENRRNGDASVLTRKPKLSTEDGFTVEALL